MGSKVITGCVFVGLSDVLDVVVFVLGVVLSAPPCLVQAELLLLELHVPSEQYWPAFAAGAKAIEAKTKVKAKTNLNLFINASPIC